jgi:hypothetical protein
MNVDMLGLQDHVLSLHHTAPLENPKPNMNTRNMAAGCPVSSRPVVFPLLSLSCWLFLMLTTPS